MLHPALPLLCWLMMAQPKGFTPSNAHIDAVCHIASHIASGRFRENAPEATPNRTVAGTVAADCNTLLTSRDCDRLPGAEAALVRSILCRARYGGMRCDVDMLQGFARVWFTRFLGQAPPPARASSWSSALIAACVCGCLALAAAARGRGGRLLGVNLRGPRGC